MLMTTNEDHSRSTEPAQAGTLGEEDGEAGRSPPPMRVVGIGTSAGGLGALKKLFASVPERPGVCFYLADGPELLLVGRVPFT